MYYEPALRQRRRATPRAGKVFAARGLVIAAALAGLIAADTAQAFGDGNKGFEDRARSFPPAGNPPPSGKTATIPAARAWSLHKPMGKPARATLILKCAEATKLSVYVSFPDRVWDGAAFVMYRIGAGRPRHARPGRDRRGGAEWLGGGELVRELGRAGNLEVLIDDVGLGPSEAIFDMSRSRAAVQRIAKACADERQTPALAPKSGKGVTESSSADRPRLPEGRSREQPPIRPAEQGRSAPLVATKPLKEEQRYMERPPGVPLKDESGGTRPSEPVPPLSQKESPSEARQDVRGSSEQHVRAGADLQTSPSAPEQAAPAPLPAEPEAAQPQRSASAHAAEASKPRESPAPPTVRAIEPSPENARLAAFVQRYGPNRQGELIYGWYSQCLGKAGIDRASVWYLSDQELYYLSKGETDRVRLSMLVSTAPNLAVPPRRVTCYGAARGRDLAIERTE